MSDILVWAVSKHCTACFQQTRRMQEGVWQLGLELTSTSCMLCLTPLLCNLHFLCIARKVRQDVSVKLELRCIYCSNSENTGIISCSAIFLSDPLVLPVALKRPCFPTCHEQSQPAPHTSSHNSFPPTTATFSPPPHPSQRCLPQDSDPPLHQTAHRPHHPHPSHLHHNLRPTVSWPWTLGTFSQPNSWAETTRHSK